MAIGAVLLVAGLFLSVWALQPVEGTKTRTITLEYDLDRSPDSSVMYLGSWTFLEFSMWYHGQYSMSSSILSSLGTDQNYFHWTLISQSEYENLKAGRNFTEPPIQSAGLGNYTFSGHFPTSGKYYLLLDNIWSPPQQEFDVSIHYRVSGVNLVLFVPGVVILLAAVSFLLLGILIWRKGFEPHLGKDHRAGSFLPIQEGATWSQSVRRLKK